MTRTISEQELREDRGEIHSGLERGDDFLVTRNGVLIGELRPIPRNFVPRDLMIEAFRHAPALDAKRSRDDVDSVLDQDIEPRTRPASAPSD